MTEKLILCKFQYGFKCIQFISTQFVVRLNSDSTPMINNWQRVRVQLELCNGLASG